MSGLRSDPWSGPSGPQHPDGVASAVTTYTVASHRHGSPVASLPTNMIRRGQTRTMTGTSTRKRGTSVPHATGGHTVTAAITVTRSSKELTTI